MSPKIKFDQPGEYRIRVQGKLDGYWAAYFEELDIQHEQDSEGTEMTVLTGNLSDQAALQGVLQKLYNLGFPLLMAEKLDHPPW